MELKKYHASEILHIIRHNMRALPDGKYGNDSIVPELREKNEELISRGKTPEEVNQYRKDLEKEIFKYNRKNLVKAVSCVIQLPDDCPPEEEERFFKTCYQFWADRLPMGERCIIQAAVHRDEIVKNADGQRISHNHMHVLFIPAVPDKKHEGYEYKLNAYELTKKPVLKALHPDLQKYLDKEGIHATVYSKRKDGGHTLKLSVADLKRITEITGGSFTGTVTVEDLAELINTSFEKDVTIQNLTHEISQKNQVMLQDAMKLAEMKEKVEDATKALSKSHEEKEKLKEELEARPQKSTKRTFSWSNREQKETVRKDQEVTL